MGNDEKNFLEGIVLQSILYGENDKILTLFTDRNGLFKIFVKNNKKHLHPPYVNPFAKAEFLYITGTSLPKLHEATLLEANYHVRNSLENLEIAIKMNQALLQSQSQGKSAPKLYILFSQYLGKLPQAMHPTVLYPSFLLKILKHEGLLQKKHICSVCHEHLQEIWRFGGEIFCKKHALKGADLFTSDEEKALFFLSESRSFSEISSFFFEKSFTEKIEILFERALQH